MNYENILVDFYNENKCVKPQGLVLKKTELAIMGNRGLGDCTILTNLIKKAKEVGREMQIFCPSNHFHTLRAEIPDYDFNPRDNMSFARVEYFEQYNFGNGHIIQKMQRALGFTADIKPKGFLKTSNQRKPRICLHLSTGHSALELLEQHMRPRQFYAENIQVLQRFVDIYSDKFEFAELGGSPIGLSGVANYCGATILDSIEVLKESEFLIGLNSGFMNLAAALDVKGIIIVNLPKVEQLYLPMLSDAPITDLTWLYPQNVHLHQDGENELVPRFSFDNLERAVRGEVYPFWKDDYLNLVNKYAL